MVFSLKTFSLHLSSFVLGCLVSTNTLASERLKATTLAGASRDVQNAVRISSFLLENQIKVDLTKKSLGFVIVNAEIETLQNFHLYEDRIQFWTEKDPSVNGQEWKVELLETPPVTRFLDPVSRGLKNGYKGQSLFKLKISLPGNLPHSLPEGHSIPLVIMFQACSNKICLLPTAIKSDVAIAKVTRGQDEGFFDRLGARFKKGLSSSNVLSLGNILVLLIAGLITAFTPCVYPLYPITLGIFSRWSQSSKSSPLALALSYCTGLTLSYACLGLLSAASGSVFGSLTQRPEFLIGMGLCMFLGALAFSGLIPIQAPQFLMTLFAGPAGASPATPTRRMLQAASMGVGLGVVASPCVGPVLVTLLAWLSSALVTSKSAYLSGFILLSFFGIGLSLPFLVIGHIMLKMGRSVQLGRYTPYFKHLGTGLMVMASLYFLIPGLKLAFSDSHENPLSKHFTVYDLESWKQQRVSVLDFRADWCAACVQLEKETFSAEKIIPYFKNEQLDFVKVDLTQMTPELQKLSQDYNVVSLPAVLFVKKDGSLCPSLTLNEFENAKNFKLRLDRALEECLAP